MKPVRDIRISPQMTTNDIMKAFENAGGFTARKLAVATNILEDMMTDDECFTFLSFPADIIATGVRGVIAGMIRDKLVDAVITTCGTLDHDIARTWEDYYHGDFLADDVKLRKKGINRLGNVFVPNESYGIILEKRLQPIFSSIYEEKKELSTRELIWKVGEKLSNEVERENSIVYQAYKNKIPIYVPGPFDGAFGYQLWAFWQTHKDLKLNLFLDEQELSDIVFTHKKTGALILGGGISKHHTIWWNQFKEGLNFAVYITTAPEWDGSLSGARLREAISWGKVNEKAKHETVEGDITVLLPLMMGAIYERIYSKKNDKSVRVQRSVKTSKQKFLRWSGYAFGFSRICVLCALVIKPFSGAPYVIVMLSCIQYARYGMEVDRYQKAATKRKEIAYANSKAASQNFDKTRARANAAKKPSAKIVTRVFPSASDCSLTFFVRTKPYRFLNKPSTKKTAMNVEYAKEVR